MGNVVGIDLTSPHLAGRRPLERIAAGDLDLPSMLLAATLTLLAGFLDLVAGHRRGADSRADCHGLQ
jgi:hypothetical protein